MTLDELFLCTLDDLEERLCGQSTEYDVLMAAALLRKLLLDDSALIDAVNRSRRMKLRFAVTPHLFDHGPPSLSDPLISWVDRGAFLATEVLLAPAYGASVRRIIRHLANKAGAVHLDDSTGDGIERDLAQLHAGTKLAGWSPAIRALPTIAYVTLRALLPLRRAVDEGSPSFSRPSSTHRDRSLDPVRDQAWQELRRIVEEEAG